MPDESTILRFRHLLEQHELAVAIFAEVNAVRERAEHEAGSVVDATILQAAGVVELADWPDCADIGRIDTVRQVTGKAATLVKLHYNVGEDGSTECKDHASQYRPLLKKIVLYLIVWIRPTRINAARD
jgi:hypothetical protein